MKHEWPVGGLWEDEGLCIVIDQQMDRIVNGSVFHALGRDPGPPCPHAQDLHREPLPGVTQP